MRSVTIDSILGRVDDLPELPQVASKILQLINDPETSASDLAQVISTDQALTARVLRLCNSAYYGMSRKVTTVNEGVTILGFSAIKSLVLIATAYGTVSQSLIGYGMKPGELWTHSLSCAEHARQIAAKVGYAEPDEAFTAGLLHDIGKIVLNQHALPEIYRANNLCMGQQIPVHEAETQVLGFSHAEIGAKLAERWNLPPVLCEAIGGHHERIPSEAKLPSIVTIANAMASGDDFELPVSHLQAVGLGDFAALQLHEEVKKSLVEMNRMVMAIA
jgi:putative nucleotidyltransferase with HDIG domain